MMEFLFDAGITDDRGYPVRIPPCPAISADAIDYFDSILGPDFEVFELGAGGSTVWIARRVKHVISIEHSEPWYKAIISVLETMGLENIDLRFRPLEPNKIDPFSQYAEEVLKFNDGFFDLVFIDGWDAARVPCTAYAANKVKRGGFLVVDDTTQPYIYGIFSILRNWKRLDLCGQSLGRTDGAVVRSQTTFFEKPL